MQHFIDLTLSDYCGRLILLVMLALDAATTIYALHHQPANKGFAVVEGNPIVAVFVKLLGVEGAMLVTKALGVAMTYYFVPIWPVFLFGLAAWIGWFVVSNVRVILKAGAAVLALAVGLSMTPRPALAADLVMRLSAPGAEIRLYDTACAVADLRDQIKDEYRDQFKAARAIVNDHVINGCWIDYDGKAMILFESGERLALPMDKFSDPMV